MRELFNNLRVQNIFAFMTHMKHRSHNIVPKKKIKDKWQNWKEETFVIDIMLIFLNI